MITVGHPSFSTSCPPISYVRTARNMVLNMPSPTPNFVSVSVATLQSLGMVLVLRSREVNHLLVSAEPLLSHGTSSSERKQPHNGSTHFIVQIVFRMLHLTPMVLEETARGRGKERKGLG